MCTTLSVLVAFSSLVCRSGFEASGGEANASPGCFKCEQLVRCIVNCISASVGDGMIFPILKEARIQDLYLAVECY